MQELNISKSILAKFQSIGFQDSNQIQNFAFDFRDRPEMLSSTLQKDFAFPTLDSHFARAAILHVINSSSPPSSSSSSSSFQNTKNACLDDNTSYENLNGATNWITPKATLREATQKGPNRFFSKENILLLRIITYFI